MTQIVILAGEGEYQSDVSMRAVEGDLRAISGNNVTFCSPDVLPDAPDFPQSTIPGLDALADADLLIVFTRFRRLPDKEMQLLSDYLDRRGAVVGLRTSTHAFHFPDDSPWASWNDGFGRSVLGSPWITHHGHVSSTHVSRIGGADHPLLDGVADSFDVRSWLYQVELSDGCVPLLHGDPVNTKREPVPGPVAWTREPGGRHGRVVFTSLGHPADFGVPSFRRLLVNAAAWCTS